MLTLTFSELINKKIINKKKKKKKNKKKKKKKKTYIVSLIKKVSSVKNLTILIKIKGSKYID